MTLRLVRAEPQHVGEVGRICFKALKEIDDWHGFPRGFPTLDFALKVVGMLVERKDFYGVVALIDGKVANLMAMRPYEPPDVVWMPSVLY